MIGEISFCDQIGFNIKSDETKRFILDRIQQKYGLKIITKHFERYDDRMLEGLQNRPHLLCVRTNGNPYFMYLTRLNFVNYCIFIDKKIQQGYSYPRMIISHFKFDDVLFNDTMFDGEMVKTTTGRWFYLLNDLMVLRGQHLTDYNLVKRLNMLYETLSTCFASSSSDICNILVKKYFRYPEAMDIIQSHMNSVDYSCRGIYFKPLFLRFKDVLLNFDDNLIKKVERTKYKHLKSFMLKEDGAKLLDCDSASVVSIASDASYHSHESRDSTRSPKTSSTFEDVMTVAVQQQLDPSIKFFNTRKTNLPDVYELIDSNMRVIGTAAVPSLQVSKHLRQVFETKNIVDTVTIKYTFSERFNKWLPITT